MRRMNIERGDLFVVTRGFQLGKMPEMISLFGGGGPPRDDNPTYDRSHEGRVYKALQVCGPVIAAECVHEQWAYRGTSISRLGQRFSINTGDVEVWPVTEQYLAALTEPNA